ncbi:MAG: hypothetical protein WAP35_04470 [Solirubrobacterales bacterium]
MQQLPGFAQPLDGDQRASALAALESVLPNIDFAARETPARVLDRARIVYEYAGITSRVADLEHLLAVLDAAESIGESHSLIHHPSKSRLLSGRDSAGADIALIDHALLREFLFEEQRREAAGQRSQTESWPEAARELIEPRLPFEWSWGSQHGTWVTASWDLSDVNAMAASDQFIDAYVAARPDAPRDCVEWMLGEGHVFLERGKRPLPGYTRWQRFTRVAPIRGVELFPDSSLEQYLVRLYGRDAAAALWEIYAATRLLDSDRPIPEGDRALVGRSGVLFDAEGSRVATEINGTPDQRLARLIEADPSVDARLREIWND